MKIKPPFKGRIEDRRPVPEAVSALDLLKGRGSNGVEDTTDPPASVPPAKPTQPRPKPNSPAKKKALKRVSETFKSGVAKKPPQRRSGR